jgi:hypothetical protein
MPCCAVLVRTGGNIFFVRTLNFVVNMAPCEMVRGPASRTCLPCWSGTTASTEIGTCPLKYASRPKGQNVA